VLGHSIDNVRDMLERNPNGCQRKLTPEQVREIRTAYKSDPFPSTTELAARYGLSKTAVGNVLNGKSYGYVSD
jgi:transcriptional regulator of aromatic amino acid metabolism